MRKKYLVAGGNGYIGSHMCRYLTGLGHDVFIIDNFCTSPKRPVHSYGKFFVNDISDIDAVSRIFSEMGTVDGVFHFAARTLVGESEERPLLYYNENVNKTLLFLHACQLAGVQNFIFSSTCAVFGLPLPQVEKLNEEHPHNPVNTYGKTKSIMEQIMRDLARKNVMNFVVFRYFNACGTSPEGDLGEEHEPETHLIPNLCRSFVSGGSVPFSLFGDKYPTRDGTCNRDYIHVEDLVRVHHAGVLHLEKQSGFFDFNLGSEHGHTVKEVISTFERVTGKKMQLTISPARPGDPPSLVGDATKARTVLGFRCEYELQDCIEHTLNWFHKAAQRK